MNEEMKQERIKPARGPWEIYDFEGKVKDYPKTIIVAPTGESICEIAGGWPQCTLAENEANTALIVRAVNNHDPLITILKQMLNVFYPHACLPGSVCARCETLVAAQRAIAAAQEQS